MRVVQLVINFQNGSTETVDPPSGATFFVGWDVKAESWLFVTGDSGQSFAVKLAANAVSIEEVRQEVS